MMKSLSSGLAGLFLLVSHGVAESPESPEGNGAVRLPNIVELRILDDRRVFLRSLSDRALHRIAPDGGWVDDHHFIDADTGELRERPTARARNEIVLTVGESSQDATEGPWNRLQFQGVERETAVFLVISLGRDNKERRQTIEVSPYVDPDGNPTRSGSRAASAGFEPARISTRLRPRSSQRSVADSPITAQLVPHTS